MSCALTADFTLDCKDSIGGIREAYVMEFENVSGIVETAGVITAMVNAIGKQFRRYKLQRETSSAESPIVGNPQNGSVFSNHAVKLVLNKLQTAIRNEVILLAKNRLIIVVLDCNGRYWLLGKTAGLDLTNGANGTGTASGDRSGYELDFAGQEPEPMVEVNAIVGAALTTPGA